MKLEELVLTIEQAIHLQELGLDMSDAAHFWCSMKTDKPKEHPQSKRWFITLVNAYKQCEPLNLFEYIPTYTLQETLNKLPKTIIMNGEAYVLDISLTPQASIHYFSARDDEDYMMFKNKELLMAAYKMLCWLLENKHL